MSEEGFTLVETLLALALGAMVVGAVLSTVKVAAGGARRAAEATAGAEALARAAAVLQGDADHALAAPGLWRALAMDLPAMPRYGGAPARIAYRLEAGATRLTRDGATVWQAGEALSFRYLGPQGWVADWPDGAPPLAFAVEDRGILVLASRLPDLLPLACTRGPGPDCPLPAEDFR